jgi:hypothetical protein
MIPFLAPALSLLTSPLGRAAIVFAAGAALAGFGAWSYQGAKLDALRSAHAAAAAQAQALQTRERLRATEAAISDQSQTEALYAKLQAQLRSQGAALHDAAERDRRRAATQRLLNNTCARAAGEGVPPGAPERRLDAVAPQWQPERWLPSF